MLVESEPVLSDDGATYKVTVSEVAVTPNRSESVVRAETYNFPATPALETTPEQGARKKLRPGAELNATAWPSSTRGRMQG